jgi:hypothetical protein
MAASGRRDSNPLPKAWEAFALPGELLPRNANVQKHLINQIFVSTF